jgi:hypothetical protein
MIIDELHQLLRRVQSELPSRCKVTKSLLDGLPAWFRDLGTESGVATLERRINARIPESLRLFYRFPATGCWLLAHHDTDILLEGYSLEERPHLVWWYYRPHLVLAEFSHSQTVCAVQLNSDNPRIEWGEDGAQNPFDYPPAYFVQWLTRIANTRRERDSEDRHNE